MNAPKVFAGRPFPRNIRFREEQARVIDLTNTRISRDRARTGTAVSPMRSPSIDTLEDPSSALFHVFASGRNPECSLSIEGPRMSEPYAHEPVMLDEVCEIFAGAPGGLVVDATVGGAGHASRLLQRFPNFVLLGMDQDSAAVEAARVRLAPFGARAEVLHGRFDQLDEILSIRRDIGVSGVLFDLGVSSPQLDRPDRGFSFRADGPLDMRMDRGRTKNAADVVNEYDEQSLVRMFAENGEPRMARRIAQAIIAARPLASTAQLAEIVRNAIPAALRRTGGHPARRIFQAIRIEVNEELGILGTAVDSAINVLQPGGRCVVLSYHSGEDRVVKERFLDAATGGCVCPSGMPCVCGAVPTVELVTRGSRKPSAEEVASNPRSGSARLRAVIKLGTTNDDA